MVERHSVNIIRTTALAFVERHLFLISKLSSFLAKDLSPYLLREEYRREAVRSREECHRDLRPDTAARCWLPSFAKCHGKRLAAAAAVVVVGAFGAAGFGAVGFGAAAAGTGRAGRSSPEGAWHAQNEDRCCRCEARIRARSWCWCWR